MKEVCECRTPIKFYKHYGKWEHSIFPLTRIYRMLYSEELYLVAYNKLYRNKGALTPGSAERHDRRDEPRRNSPHHG